tara:strand:+ start:506 stop:1423 length:918 start_codon:yes stop_codon:yes gene_type:complete
MKSLLITGANGFIGKNLLRSREINNYDVYGTYLTTKPDLKKDNKTKFIKVDLIKNSELIKLPKKIDYIVHLAGDARTFLDKKFENEQIKNNQKITNNLLKYAKKTKCIKLIFLSSVYVYSGNTKKIYKENLKLNPCEPLGKSKIASEQLIKKFIKLNKISYLILRAFTIYGQNSRKTQFLPMLKKKIDNKKDKKIIIKKPEIMRDFLHANDLVDVINLCLKKKIAKKIYTFNVGFGKSLSIKSVVKKLLKISNKQKKLIFLANNKTKNLIGDKNHYADINKIKKFFKWKPKISINNGLRKFYEQS